MAKNIFGKLFAIATIAFVFNGCEDKCYYYQEEIEYQEILTNVDEVKNSFEVVADFAIKKPGNIYSYQSYLFVAEQNEGIHILNNTNPASPVPLKFIKLKGNANFAVANDVLLADNGADLLSINFADLNNIKIEKRTENVNPDILRPDNKILSGYKEVKVKRKIPCEDNNRFGSNQSISPVFSSSAGGGGTVSTGKAGSMAKFAVVNNYLYIAHSAVLQPLNISDPSHPIKLQKIQFSSDNIETIFPYKDYLYFGTSSGVLIYDCSSNPEVPVYRRTLSHALGCDPVVVSEDFCFSTVRNGTACRWGNTINSLYVFNVTDVNKPFFVNEVGLTNPYGLGVKDNLLFICQAESGLSVFNWNKLTGQVTLKHNYPDIHAYDVIVNDNTLIVTADNGLFQFDCTDPDNIKYLATLSNF
ncbi:MAG: hypothetical protein V4613_05650 [Bacteroidota bacterium]